MNIMMIGNDTTYVYNLRDLVIQRLTEDGHHIDIVCEPRLFQDELNRMGCRLIPVTIGRHGKNPLHDIKLMKQYKKIIIEENPNMIFAYNLKPVIYGILAAKNKETKDVNCFAMIPGAGYVFSGEDIKAKTIKLLIKRMYKMSLNHAKCVFFQNVDDKKQFIEENIVKE